MVEKGQAPAPSHGCLDRPWSGCLLCLQVRIGDSHKPVLKQSSMPTIGVEHVGELVKQRVNLFSIFVENNLVAIARMPRIIADSPASSSISSAEFYLQFRKGSHRFSVPLHLTPCSPQYLQGCCGRLQMNGPKLLGHTQLLVATGLPHKAPSYSFVKERVPDLIISIQYY
jgi:hypothetical protein